MSSHLVKFFKRERLARNLTLGDVGLLVGYRDRAKGAGRVHRFEATGEIHPDLLRKLCDLFGIGQEIVDELAEQDRRQFFQEWNRWANEPVEPRLVLRLLPAVHWSVPIPEPVASIDEAEAFASMTARAWHRSACLVVSRRFSVWFDEDGSVYSRTEAIPGEPNTPYMFLRGCRRAFVLKTVPAVMMQSVQWPMKTGRPRNEEGG